MRTRIPIASTEWMTLTWAARFEVGKAAGRGRGVWGGGERGGGGCVRKKKKDNSRAG